MNIQVKTYVYSSPSLGRFEKLMEAIFEALGSEYRKASDIFYYGVFCKEGTYAFFDWSNDPEANCVKDIPSKLRNPLEGSNTKRIFVHATICDILRGKIEKPEWMEHIEQSFCYDDEQTSTFLYILPKTEEFKDVARLLDEFLYSVNMNTTMLSGITDFEMYEEQQKHGFVDRIEQPKKKEPKFSDDLLCCGCCEQNPCQREEKQKLSPKLRKSL